MSKTLACSNIIIFLLVNFLSRLNVASNGSGCECGAATECCKVDGLEDDDAPAAPEQGADFFDLVVTGDRAFVDKTLLIAELLQNPAGKVILITQPRGFGKTINADMLRRFLDVEVDENGKSLPPERSLNRKLFVGGTISLDGKNKSLKPLSIASDDSTMQYQGKFPVIYMNFKNIRGSTYEEFEAAIRNKLDSAINEYGYLKQYMEERAICKTLFDFSGEFGQTHLERGLEYLCDLLSIHFGREVYVIVDDYDTPIMNAFLEFGDSEELIKVLNLLSSIYRNALKGNRLVKGGLITGIVPVFRYSLNANPIFEYVMMDQRICTYYGFTKNEVEQLISKIANNSESALSLLNDVKDYCFQFKVNESEIYNSKLTNAYLTSLKNGNFGHCWSASNEKCFVKKTLLEDQIQDNMQNLITGKKKILFSFTKSLDFGYFSKHSILLNVLAHSGYILPMTNDAHQKQVSRFASCYSFVPNKEAEFVHRINVLRWVCSKMNITRKTFDSLVQLLPLAKIEQFQQEFRSLLRNAIYFAASERTRAKIFYRAFAVSMVGSLSSNYRLANETGFTGHDKLSVLLLPKVITDDDYPKTTILFGYYVATREVALKSVAENGLKKIAQEENQTELDNRVVLKFCLSFFKKNVTLHYQIDDRRTRASPSL